MSKAKILIVDDEENIRLFLQHVLETEGHEIMVAQDGLESELLTSTNEFDIIITDIHMPKSGGLEVLFNTHDKMNPPDVIVISGGGRDLSYYFEEAKMLGAIQTLKKPFTSKDIITSVNEVLAERSSRESS